MSRINLTEFVESGPLQFSNETILVLREKYNKYFEIRKENEFCFLKPRSYVGFIKLPEVTIYIKPKIPDENLLFILSYLYDQIDLNEEVDLSQMSSDSILDLMALVLTTWVNKLIKQGLYKRYIKKQEKIPKVRGKIIPVKNLFYFDKIHCAYDELSHSVYENIILKSTLRLILSMNVIDEIKGYSRILIKLLSEVGDAELTESLFRRIHYTRLNKNYYKILELCRLIYKNYSTGIYGDDVQFPGFFIDMNKVFEEFIRKFLILNLLEEDVRKRHISGWAMGENMSYLPEMQPDIVIGNKLVIDVKYYRSVLGSNDKFHSANLYQILAYMKVLRINGMLIYPESGFRFNESYEVDGKYFFIKTIKMDGTRDEFREGLHCFANDIRRIINKE